MSDTYKRDYKCDNCGHKGPAELPKGELAPQKRKCDGCGCETAMLVAIPVTRELREPEFNSLTRIGTLRHPETDSRPIWMTPPQSFPGSTADVPPPSPYRVWMDVNGTKTAIPTDRIH